MAYLNPATMPQPYPSYAANSTAVFRSMQPMFYAPQQGYANSPLSPVPYKAPAPYYPSFNNALSKHDQYKQIVASLPNAQMGTMSPEINQALVLLGEIRHLPGDTEHMQNLGVDLIFNSGEDALKLLKQKNLRVEFGPIEGSAHAQWLAEDGLIMLNQKYQGDFSSDMLHALSEAIYHEAGHAARYGDDQASIQEETNCLALNTLAYRFHKQQDPNYGTSGHNSRLIEDGVALYAKLFFDKDPQKRALVERIIEKYGMLPSEGADNGIRPIHNSNPNATHVHNVPLVYKITRRMHDMQLEAQTADLQAQATNNK